MSSQNNDDAFLNLFSTRSGRKQITDSKTSESVKNNQTNNSTQNSGLITPSSNTGSRSSINRSVHSQQKKDELTPLGNTILKESRRELGNQGSLGEGSTGAVAEHQIAQAVDTVLAKRGDNVGDLERAAIIVSLQRDLLGWGVLQPLVDDPEVTDIHCYDYQTVVLQRGKNSETTGLHWPSKQTYAAFIDRLLLRLGKSLSTQQHTVDASLPDGVRICAIHDSVCGTRGPLLCLRIPRMKAVSLENLISYQVAPPLIVNYLAALVRSCMCTFIVAGETGTGKTTTIKCLATQFGEQESIVSVEDTPELNFDHPYYRCLVSRPANTEGAGEVTLSEHIRTTLRMTPTRVILGEMRTPEAAEAFLEAAQTGHVGMTTVHARNAKETLVRLESLLGRAQKSVAVDIIRQQIALAVDVVMWLCREKETGKPRISEVIEVGHFVEGAIQIKPIFTQTKTGNNPIWRLDSWSSTFDEVLNGYGINLGEAPQEISFNQKRQV
jgi:pilus assembly protein CpaF